MNPQETKTTSSLKPINMYNFKHCSVSIARWYVAKLSLILSSSKVSTKNFSFEWLECFGGIRSPNTQRGIHVCHFPSCSRHLWQLKSVFLFSPIEYSNQTTTGYLQNRNVFMSIHEILDKYPHKMTQKAMWLANFEYKLWHRIEYHWIWVRNDC